MRIAIFGAGGVGGYFGGRLAQAGQEVVFMARGKHLQALHNRGLRVDSLKGDFVVQPVQATHDPSQVGIVDVIVLGVKAWQVPEAAQAMRPMVGADTFVVPLQNGVEAPTQLASVLGREQVLGGLCRLIAFIVEPGHIRHAGAEPLVQFGELDNRPSKRAEKLRQAFAQATGLTAEIPPDIEAAMWQKFMFISAWSGVGAVSRAPLGVFRSQPGTRQMLKQVMQEIYEVAQARKISLPPEIINETMKVFDSLPADGTASMQRDIIEGRPSELEVQNGAVVCLGQEVGIETPVNAFIYHSLLAMERQARGEMIPILTAKP